MLPLPATPPVLGTTTGYTGGVFDVHGVQWTQTSYIQPQMHPYDAFFYDVATHNYTVSRWLDDLRQRYGAPDLALVWPT